MQRTSISLGVLLHLLQGHRRIIPPRRIDVKQPAAPSKIDVRWNLVGIGLLAGNGLGVNPHVTQAAHGRPGQAFALNLHDVSQRRQRPTSYQA